MFIIIERLIPLSCNPRVHGFKIIHAFNRNITSALRTPSSHCCSACNSRLPWRMQWITAPKPCFHWWVSGIHVRCSQMFIIIERLIPLASNPRIHGFKIIHAFNRNTPWTLRATMTVRPVFNTRHVWFMQYVSTVEPCHHRWFRWIWIRFQQSHSVIQIITPFRCFQWMFWCKWTISIYTIFLHSATHFLLTTFRTTMTCHYTRYRCNPFMSALMTFPILSNIWTFHVIIRIIIIQIIIPVQCAFRTTCFEIINAFYNCFTMTLIASCFHVWFNAYIFIWMQWVAAPPPCECMRTISIIIRWTESHEIIQWIMPMPG